jgi:hypothetical protein
MFILSFRQLKGLSESRKKIGGFHIKKNIGDVITGKQMTSWNFIWYKNVYFYKLKLTCPKIFLKKKCV